MTDTRRARQSPRRTEIRWLRVAGLLVVVAVAGAVLGDMLLAASSSTAASPGERASAKTEPRSEHRRRALGEADGAVPSGTTVFDETIPGVRKLDPALVDALRKAALDAAAQGLLLVVDSGWRSAAYQAHLLREAVTKHGSEAEAARWVATPDTSSHVSGDAVDIGPPGAAAWLSEHGARYGLCRIYGNESWHFELRPEAVGRGCPPVYADPTHDPRMRQGSAARAGSRLEIEKHRPGLAPPKVAAARAARAPGA